MRPDNLQDILIPAYIWWPLFVDVAWIRPKMPGKNQISRGHTLKEGLGILQEAPSLKLQISVGFSPFTTESREKVD